jgi:hypothetical protein
MDKCEFEYNGRKCTAETSKEKPFIYHDKAILVFSIARCKGLCPIHYNQVVKDNIRKFNKGIEITEKLDFTKKLGYNEIWSFFGLQSKTDKLNSMEVKDNGK